MALIPPSLERLTRELSRFPGIGMKTAQRLAFFCIRAGDDTPVQLAAALMAVHESVGQCTVCGFIAEGELCEVCRNPARNTAAVCVVEQPLDVLAIERSGEFHGRYHVLWGALSPIDGVGPAELRIGEFLTRVREEHVHEVILATDPDVEGDATAQYIAERLASTPEITVSRLAYGLPAGADVEYADAVTIARALAGRRSMA